MTKQEEERLDQNIKWYKDNQDLINLEQGNYVLINDGRILKYFNNYPEAIEITRKLNLQPGFIIKNVHANDSDEEYMFHFLNSSWLMN